MDPDPNIDPDPQLEKMPQPCVAVPVPRRPLICSRGTAGRGVHCEAELSPGLPAQPAQDEVQLGDLPPEHLSGRTGLHLHTPSARQRSARWAFLFKRSIYIYIFIESP
jgi:hypothetical protein